jgi:UDP-GlcNAc:undecaprenyl-phosphate GlcNAc-1-phosphate transferase
MLKIHLPEYSVACFALGCGTAVLVLRMLIARTFQGWLPAFLQARHQRNEQPIPKTGGVAVVCGILVVALIGWLRGAHLAAPSATTGLLVGMGGMFVVGLVEDFFAGFGRYRIPSQIVVALGSVASGLRMDHSTIPLLGEFEFTRPWALVVTVAWLVLCTNVIVLVNGVDGLAGGISLMVLGLTYDVALGLGDAGVALFIAGMAGGLVALLWYNFPPAKIALGRNGTYLLGIALGGLSIEVSHKGALQFAFLAPTLAMGLPFLDMAVVLGRRLVRGMPLFRADRRHIHHRLQEQGLEPIQTLMVLYTVSVCFLAGGFVVMWTRGQLIPLVLTLLAVLMLLFVHQLGRTEHSVSLGSRFRESSAIRMEIRNAELLGRWMSIQAQRVNSVDEFWERFCRALDDMRLCGAEVQASGFDRFYSSGLPKGDGLSSRHRITGPGGIEIQVLIRGDSSRTPVHLFHTLAELAAEGLQAGLQRFRRLD